MPSQLRTEPKSTCTQSGSCCDREPNEIQPIARCVGSGVSGSPSPVISSTTYFNCHGQGEEIELLALTSAAQATLRSPWKQKISPHAIKHGPSCWAGSTYIRVASIRRPEQRSGGSMW